MNVFCESCGELFNKDPCDIKRTKKNFCSKECAGYYGDKYSPFKKMFNHTVERVTIKKSIGKEMGFDLHLKDLYDMYNSQNGKCPYTGWELDLLKKSGPARASIDRKDSQRGYTKDNVHLCSLMANHAKNKFTEQELLSFCWAVTEKFPPQTLTATPSYVTMWGDLSSKSGELPCN